MTQSYREPTQQTSAQLAQLRADIRGGPSLMYAARASAAFDEFAALAAPATA